MLPYEMPGHELTEMPRSRPVLLRNSTCVYCGCALTKATSTKEHVVGRRFVPKGSLDKDWNLIVRACKPCNVKKSDLEDDISAITMHTDAFGHSVSTQSQADAQRKMRGSVSRKTGRPVAESAERLSVQVPFAPFGLMTAEFTAPPQIEEARAYELARTQMMAFFYFLTYNAESNRGHYWPGDFYPVMEARRADWGNPIHRAFMASVQDWEPRLLVATAADHYAVIIRKHPTAACWSWAVEWNKSYRLVGFFGELDPAREVVNTFPELKVTSVIEGENRWMRYRVETPLQDDDDLLFLWSPTSEI